MVETDYLNLNIYITVVFDSVQLFVVIRIIFNSKTFRQAPLYADISVTYE